MLGDFIYRHRVEPRVNHYSPREEPFPIPLKYIDVSSTTHSNFDVVQESRIDDCWNVDGSRDLRDPWTGITQFTLLEEKPRDEYMWSGREINEKTANVQARSFMARTLDEIGKSSCKGGKSGHMKSQNLIMPENCEVFFSLTQKTKNLEKPSTMFARNWKRQWLPLCLARQARTVSMA